MGFGPGVNKALDDGRGPLFQAAKNGHAGVVELLMRHGAAVDKARDKGRIRTPLIILVAARQKCFEVVSSILRTLNKENVNAQLLDGPSMDFKNGSMFLCSRCVRRRQSIQLFLACCLK